MNKVQNKFINPVNSKGINDIFFVIINDLYRNNFNEALNSLTNTNYKIIDYKFKREAIQQSSYCSTQKYKNINSFIPIFKKIIKAILPNFIIRFIKYF